jgi:hypothetical protein
MSLDISSMSSGGAEPIAIGAYPARVQAIVAYGIQPMTDWKTGADKAPEKRLAVTFEFPTESVEVENDDGTISTYPRRLTKEFKVSNHKKSGLMQLIMAVKPDATNLTQLLSQPCSVTVGRTGTGKAKVESFSPIMKGMIVDDLMDGTVSFDFDEPDEIAFKSLTTWQQDMIVRANNYTGFADEWIVREQGADY